jgi:phytoene/squalene synthetase
VNLRIDYREVGDQKERRMLNHAAVSEDLNTGSAHLDQLLRNRATDLDFDVGEDLPASITKAASTQTYYTIRFLVDHDRTCDAYRAYAYFRWLDDCLDERLTEQADRIAFVERQQTLINRGYQGQGSRDLTVEERMLVDLIGADREKDSGLHAYIRNMFAVMVFDADRKGRLITRQELADYTRHLAVGVTEALHYFIGHDDPCPQSDARYLAVTAAHITHMLRDTIEDVAAGYYNIPLEFLEAYGLDPKDTRCEAYREWVKSRVRLARAYFEAGDGYLSQVKNLRCRIAGYAYVARFEEVLNAIEREEYRLRPAYPERKNLGAALRISWAALTGALKFTSLRGER